ncbi:hypothetical protein FS749_012731 [Ceratobasidium sp. UAMH 11750]|nr:hypothetical protein FS749_012731 [Ceratobasidium sp. UAMH 11750]
MPNKMTPDIRRLGRRFRDTFRVHSPAPNDPTHSTASASSTPVTVSHPPKDNPSKAPVVDTSLVATLPDPNVPGDVKRPLPVPAALESTTKPTVKRNGWTGLKKFTALVDRSADAFGPLKSAVDGILGCIDLFETESRGREEYQKLKVELESLFTDLTGYFAGSPPPEMTTTITKIAQGIDKEIKQVVKKQERRGVERFADAIEDADEVLECYQRIQRLLGRLALNIDMNILKIVDEQATVARLKSLPNSPAATYRSADSDNLRRGGCTPNTRVDVLRQLHDWAYDNKSHRIYWLNGMAGTGKTTIAYSLCAQLERARKLAASFFCSRQLPACRDVNRIIPSIAYQLSLFSRPFRRAISNVLEENPEAYNQTLPEQFKQLVVDPLKEVEEFPADRIIVLDALDECSDKDGVDRLLDIILSNTSSLPIKFFVTSRPDAKILDRMWERRAERVRTELRLHELERNTVQDDIKTYLKSNLDRIDHSPAQLETLVARSGILFIYAATVVRYIGADNYSKSANRLDTILHSANPSSSSRGNRDIDALYTAILNEAFDDASLDDSDKACMELVLRTILCAQEPLPIATIAGLLGLDGQRSVRPALRPLLSVLHVSDTTDIITTLHESFPDFMFDRGRSDRFHCNPQQHSARLAELCFNLIEAPSSPFNICGLESSYVFDADVPDLGERIERAISNSLGYASRHWGAHLELAQPSPELIGRLEQFLWTRLMLWLEVLNLKKCMSDGAKALYKAQGWSQVAGCSGETKEMIRDALRFMTVISAGAVLRSTPHIYVSALPFWPRHRPISKRYSRRMSGLIKVTGTAIMTWESAPLAMLVAGSTIYQVACSSDGAYIAAGCEDHTARIWDAHTGQRAGSPLEGHAEAVFSVAYSPNNAHLVSGSGDMTIRIWDAHTGAQIGQPLKGHTGPVYTVVYSPNGAHIASGSQDRTVRIWDAHTAQQVGQLLEGHTDSIWSLVYSPDGARIISGASDCTIRTWDARTGQQLGQPFEGHTDSINSVVCSSDGERVISGSDDNTIRIWDVRAARELLRPLKGHNGSIRSVAYLPESEHVVSGSHGGPLVVWDIRTGQQVGRPHHWHLVAVNSVAYSPDRARIVSGSQDGTICIWDSQTNHTTGHPPGDIQTATSVAYSPDSARIISGSMDNAVRIWDARTGQQIGPSLDGHWVIVTSVAYSSDGARIASGSLDCSIRIWDAHTGQQIGQPVEGHNNTVSSVTFSSDCSRIVSGSWDHTIRIWDAYTGQQVGQPLEGHTDFVQSVALSSNGARIVSCSHDYTVRLWDAHTGLQIGQPLLGHTDCVESVAYSADGARVASGSRDSTIRIWDACTGQQIGQPLYGHSMAVNSVAYSPDDAYIVSGSEDSTLCIWDAHAGKQIGRPLKGHTGGVLSVAWAPDGVHVVSSSMDFAIRVWDVSQHIGQKMVPSPEPVNRQHESFNQTPPQPSQLLDIYDSSSQTITPSDVHANWSVNSDGWVVAEDHKLLVWTPFGVENVLLKPENTLLISTEGWLRLDFSSAMLGELWPQCYQSFPAN